VLISTIPISPLADAFGGDTLLFPRFSADSTSTVEVILMNSGDTPLSGTVQFFGMNAELPNAFPTTVIVKDTSGSIFNYTVPPRSVFRIAAHPKGAGIEISSARITPDAANTMPVNIALISRQHNGVTTSLASVSAPPAGVTIHMYV